MKHENYRIMHKNTKTWPEQELSIFHNLFPLNFRVGGGGEFSIKSMEFGMKT